MDIVPAVYSTLDSLRRVSPNGVEYWMARDLQLSLGYSRWENFSGVVEKACVACKSMDVDPANHIRRTAKMIAIGRGGKREREDFYVSRYGAYLIAMNGDPKLQQIAAAQSYFAIQTHKQEIDQKAQDIEKRIELRDRVKDANRHLGRAAKASGVQNYGVFHDAGYLGLYGLRLGQIKELKGLDRKEDLLDRVDRAELAANEFRITQTEQVLRQDGSVGEIQACETHKRVGAEVRNTIKKLGGIMPEDLPTKPSLKKLVAKRTREQKRIAKKGGNKQVH